ncbi:MAG: type II secretion system protein [Longimicrobiales bacterium]
MATPLGTDRCTLRRRLGFTLIELAVVVSFLGVITTIAIPRWHAGVEESRVARAIGDVRAIEMAIVTYKRSQREWPDDLADVGYGGAQDPWGNAYVYHVTDGSKKNDEKIKSKKDKFFKPLNSDFDLYSPGPDGLTEENIDHKTSLDDVVRAINGRYVGTGAGY